MIGAEQYNDICLRHLSLLVTNSELYSHVSSLALLTLLILIYNYVELEFIIKHTMFLGNN